MLGPLVILVNDVDFWGHEPQNTRANGQFMAPGYPLLVDVAVAVLGSAQSLFAEHRQ